ncbi:MAG: DMT family transporter [Dehalococcoidia bacterium]
MKPIHFAVLITVASIWGASFMLIKVMAEEISPLAIVWVRLGGGGVVITAVLIAMRPRIPTHRRAWADIVVVAALGTALPYVLISWGTGQIPSNLAAVLNGAMPFWVAILSTAFLPAERLTPNKAIGVSLGFLGIALIIGPDALDLRAGSTQGQFAIILAAFSYAAGAVYLRRFMLGTSPWFLAGAQNWIAFAMVTPLILAAGEVPDFPALETDTLVAAVAAAVLAQGAAIPLYYWLISSVEATQASFVTYLAPITAQFWGWLVLSEVPGAALVPGMALVIGGMIFLNRRSRIPEAAVVVSRTDH